MKLIHVLSDIREDARQNPFVEGEHYVTRTRNIPLQSIISISYMQFVVRTTR